MMMTSSSTTATATNGNHWSSSSPGKERKQLRLQNLDRKEKNNKSMAKAISMFSHLLVAIGILTYVIELFQPQIGSMVGTMVASMGLLMESLHGGSVDSFQSNRPFNVDFDAHPSDDAPIQRGAAGRPSVFDVDTHPSAAHQSDDAPVQIVLERSGTIGPSSSIWIERSDTVRDLRERVSEMTGMTDDDFYLTIGTDILNDDSLFIGSYLQSEFTTVRVEVRGRGGAILYSRDDVRSFFPSSKAPKASSKAPKATEAPSKTPKAPSKTPKATEASSKAPKASSKAPKATETSSKAPKASSKAPKATEAPSKTPKAPSKTPKATEASSKAPKASSKAPKATETPSKTPKATEASSKGTGGGIDYNGVRDDDSDDEAMKAATGESTSDYTASTADLSANSSFDSSSASSTSSGTHHQRRGLMEVEFPSLDPATHTEPDHGDAEERDLNAGMGEEEATEKATHNSLNEYSNAGSDTDADDADTDQTSLSLSNDGPKMGDLEEHQGQGQSSSPPDRKYIDGTVVEALIDVEVGEVSGNEDDMERMEVREGRVVGYEYDEVQRVEWYYVLIDGETEARRLSYIDVNVKERTSTASDTDSSSSTFVVTDFGPPEEINDGDKVFVDPHLKDGNSVVSFPPGTVKAKTGSDKYLIVLSDGTTEIEVDLVDLRPGTTGTVVGGGKASVVAWTKYKGIETFVRQFVDGDGNFGGNDGGLVVESQLDMEAIQIQLLEEISWLDHNQYAHVFPKNGNTPYLVVNSDTKSFRNAVADHKDNVPILHSIIERSDNHNLVRHRIQAYGGTKPIPSADSAATFESKMSSTTWHYDHTVPAIKVLDKTSGGTGWGWSSDNMIDGFVDEEGRFRSVIGGTRAYSGGKTKESDRLTAPVMHSSIAAAGTSVSFIASNEDAPTEAHMLKMANDRASFWIDVASDIRSRANNANDNERLIEDFATPEGANAYVSHLIEAKTATSNLSGSSGSGNSGTSNSSDGKPSRITIEMAKHAPLEFLYNTWGKKMLKDHTNSHGVIRSKHAAFAGTKMNEQKYFFVRRIVNLYDSTQVDGDQSNNEEYEQSADLAFIRDENVSSFLRKHISFDNIRRRGNNFLPYEEAKEVAHTIGITSSKHWERWRRINSAQRIEMGLPTDLHKHYGDAFEGNPAFFGYGSEMKCKHCGKGILELGIPDCEKTLALLARHEKTTCRKHPEYVVPAYGRTPLPEGYNDPEKVKKMEGRGIWKKMMRIAYEFELRCSRSQVEDLRSRIIEYLNANPKVKGDN